MTLYFIQFYTSIYFVQLKTLISSAVTISWEDNITLQYLNLTSNSFQLKKDYLFFFLPLFPLLSFNELGFFSVHLFSPFVFPGKWTNTMLTTPFFSCWKLNVLIWYQREHYNLCENDTIWDQPNSYYPSFLLNVFLGIYKRYVYWKNPLPSSGKNYSNHEDYSEENSIVF